jgi:hypothetical protein
MATCGQDGGFSVCLVAGSLDGFTHTFVFVLCRKVL